MVSPVAEFANFLLLSSSFVLLDSLRMIAHNFSIWWNVTLVSAVYVVIPVSFEFEFEFIKLELPELAIDESYNVS